MVRTKANQVPGAYRKPLASQAPTKVLSASTFVTHSSSSSRKAKNKHAGRKPICVRPTPKWQEGIREFFRLSPKDSKKKKRTTFLKKQEAVAEEKPREKACPLQLHHRDDEKE